MRRKVKVLYYHDVKRKLMPKYEGFFIGISAQGNSEEVYPVAIIENLEGYLDSVPVEKVQFVNEEEEKDESPA